MVYPSCMYTELFNPLYGTVAGLPVIAIGAWASKSRAGEVGVSDLAWVVADDDGRLRTVPYADFVVDVRYRDGAWVDTSPGAMDAE